MNKVKITLLIVIVSCFSLMNKLMAQTTTNRALDATVTTSFVSTWEKLSAVNDDIASASSSAKPSAGAYGNWDPSLFGEYNWVQYEWNSMINVVSTSVFWWSDGGGILQPTDAYVEYWNGMSWVEAGAIGTELNIYNDLTMDTWTNKIRIYMRSSVCTGIIEWQVYATDIAPCASADITTTARLNDAAAIVTTDIQAFEGDSIVIKAEASIEGHLYWSGPNNFTALDLDSLVLKNLQPRQTGVFTVTYFNDCGGFTAVQINLTVSMINDGSAFEWPAYEPTIYYDFRDEYPALEMPTKDLDDCAGVVRTVSSDWWTFKIGPNANHQVTDTAINAMLARLNKDFAYFRDTLGWPPDKRAKRGYRSAVYLYGSGLCTDNADSLAEGGWQGNIFFEGENWPMVLLSYVPVAAFDPESSVGGKDYQTGAVVHEGIHSLLADLPGARNSAWFHEGGNTWLQQEMESRKSGTYTSMGFLNAGALIAPFMPIECYSGWLQDESFGGPSAEGVNMFNGSQQICTWKNLLGGTQYGNIFPVIFSQIFGDHSVAWIWRYCENRVLEGIADTLGDYQMRRVIMEYRAKQAMLDIGNWSRACRNLIESNFGVSIKAEWQPYWKNPKSWYATPYAVTSDDGTGLLTPEYRTTPGWSGANQIPLIVEGDTVRVEFIPIGENMTCQLCYRAEDGSAVYSKPVSEGECILTLEKQPVNDLVIAVICNTDYIYEGEQTRLSHFDYRLKLGKGVKERASWRVKWYNWGTELTNTALPASSANFSASATNVEIGSSISFTDNCTNVVSGWAWDFGDGTTSTEQNPTHTYAEIGTYTVSLSATGAEGTVSTAKTNYITVTPQVGVEEKEAESNIMLYPNPAKEKCTVVIPEKLAGNVEIRVHNSIGKMVMVKTGIENTQDEIDLSVLSNGIYYISVITNNIPVTEKLIVMK